MCRPSALGVLWSLLDHRPMRASHRRRHFVIPPGRAGTDLRRAVKAIVLTVVLVVLVVSLTRLARRPRRWQGFRYRLLGRRPDPNVDDTTLADRIRSELGPLQRRLDLPHIHVMVEDHIALLHGGVAWPREAATLEEAVRRVSGIRGVESHLQVGLLPSDVRPSEGRRMKQPPSEAKRRLLAAARSAGADDAHASETVRAILAVLAERLPSRDREQLLGHLPEDVRAMSARPRRARAAAARVRTVPGLVAAVVSEADDATDGDTAAIVAAVVAEVRKLVPEEADDVAAVLPHELRILWNAGASA